MQKTRYSLGFTMVEVLVVISIIIVLSTIAWKMNSALELKTQQRKQQHKFLVLDEALQAYYEVNGTFPQASSWPQALMILNKLPQSRELLDRLSDKGEYDVWHNVLRYNWHEGMNFPVLTSAGANKVFEEPGSQWSDDISNH